jgi:chromosome partitioning protein
VLRNTVPRSVRISEAPSHGQTVMTYDPNSSGALSYLGAASELADRGAPTATRPDREARNDHEAPRETSQPTHQPTPAATSAQN